MALDDVRGITVQASLGSRRNHQSARSDFPLFIKSLWVMRSNLIVLNITLRQVVHCKPDELVQPVCVYRCYILSFNEILRKVPRRYSNLLSKIL